jgi:hypothetical protein
MSTGQTSCVLREQSRHTPLKLWKAICWVDVIKDLGHSHTIIRHSHVHGTPLLLVQRCQLERPSRLLWPLRAPLNCSETLSPSPPLLRQVNGWHSDSAFLQKLQVSQCWLDAWITGWMLSASNQTSSGLVNQSVIALSITVICVTSQEIFKRRRRRKYRGLGEGLGSRESWEFG